MHWLSNMGLTYMMMAGVKDIFCLLYILICTFIKINGSTYGRWDLPERFIGNNESIFITFAEYSEKYKPLELGDGAPDYPPPSFFTKNAAEVAVSKDASFSQYTSVNGHPRLLNIVAKFYSKLMNQELDPNENVVITVGATQALFATFQTNTIPGDEWIVIEPYFEYYIPMIKAAHGVPRLITLKPRKKSGDVTSADWTFDKRELENLFNKRTKGIVVNSPHNPTGKMFNYEELTFIANLAKKWNTLVVYDQVYEFMTFDGREHIRMATLPDMFNRTISIGSAGKIFGATGYRIGWAYGSKPLIDNLKAVVSINVRSVPTNNQVTSAISLEREFENYGKNSSYIEIFKTYTEKGRNYLKKILDDAGIIPVVPEGGFFMIANWTALAGNINLEEEADKYQSYKFTKWLIKNVRVEGFPLAGFYTKGRRYLGDFGIRFAVVKEVETFQEVEREFQKWESKQKV